MQIAPVAKQLAEGAERLKNGVSKHCRKIHARSQKAVQNQQFEVKMCPKEEEKYLEAYVENLCLCDVQSTFFVQLQTPKVDVVHTFPWRGKELSEMLQESNRSATKLSEACHLST